MRLPLSALSPLDMTLTPPTARTLHALAGTWQGSASRHESTLHQLSPYIGKTKSSMAASLLAAVTRAGDTVYDPFCGSGSVPLEAWRLGRHVIATDLSPYATLLTRAKLFPYRSLRRALTDIDCTARDVSLLTATPDLRSVPIWVRQFFHRETLREIICWVDVLRAHRRWFLLACLLGILHHQRPGFLSYPSSHTVPYLRTANFPPERYPELYEYRPLRDRLVAKVSRAFTRVPPLDSRLRRRCYNASAADLRVRRPVAAIVTSPPYMRQLDYGRDNRLRLWFLGCRDSKELDNVASPRQRQFFALMQRCFTRWRGLLKPGGYCVLVMGDRCSRVGRSDLAEAVSRVAAQCEGYSLVATYTDNIPNDRRVRRGVLGNLSEIVLVLRREPPRTTP